MGHALGVSESTTEGLPTPTPQRSPEQALAGHAGEEVHGGLLEQPPPRRHAPDAVSGGVVNSVGNGDAGSVAGRVSGGVICSVGRGIDNLCVCVFDGGMYRIALPWFTTP